MAVDSLLEGCSMVYWANWLDNASHTPEYAYSKTWHYKNVDEGESYDDAPLNPSGDAVVAIREQIATLSNPASAEADSQLALKMLLHIIGDLHQPLHMGHATDLGGNLVKVKYFGRDTNIHSVWDTNLPESAHKWSYTEWQQQIDRAGKEEESAVVSGNIDDWARESMEICGDVYRAFPADTAISYDEVARWTPVVESRLLKGGLRLAHVLNLIFDTDYRAVAGDPGSL